MKKLYKVLLLAAMCVAFASTSHADTSDLLKLLGNKDFWTTFNWEKFENSQLYAAADWRPPGWPFRAGVTVTTSYTLKIDWKDLDVDMTLYEDPGVNTPYAERKELKSILGVTGENDYVKVVEWCNANFGEAIIQDKKAEAKSLISDRVRYSVESVWTIGNATVTVTSEQVTSSAQKISHPYKTYLKFEKGTSTHITPERTEGKE